MPKSVTALVCILLGALVYCAVIGTSAWVRLADGLPAVVRAEGDLTRDALEQISARYEQQLVAARADLRRESSEWRAVAVEEASLTRSSALRESIAYRTSLETLGISALAVGAAETHRTADAAISLMTEYQRVPAAVGARLDPWTECRGNGACWQAQTTALLGAARVTAGRTSIAMRTVSDTLPSVSSNVDQITGNVARLTRPATVWERVLRIAAPAAGGAVLGAIR